MKKKLLLIIPAVILLVMIGLIVYWNPPSTPVSYKFDAVKIDADGNELGNFTIELSGRKIEPYFDNPRLDLTMTPFDGQSDLVTESDTAKFPGAEIVKHRSGAFLTIDCGVFDRSENYYKSIELCFSPDFDRWVYHEIGGEVYYVGSVSGNDSVEELYDYINPLITGIWFPE